MKKLMIAMAAVAMVGAAHAEATYDYKVLATTKPYTAKDANPSADNSGWYSFYFMNQATAQSLMDTTSAVTQKMLANWIGTEYETFAEHRESIIDASQTFQSATSFTADKYYPYYGTSGGSDTTQISDGLLVSFFDNGQNDLAYDVITSPMYNPMTGNNMYMGHTCSSSGWIAVQNVPEPTSGLLLLLGMAGLALRRKRA